MGRISKKAQILEAAAQLIHDEGIERLTLEAAARKAGVSKGGLLYHFPSKAVLIKELVLHMIDVYKGNVKQGVQEDLPKGRWTRAFITETFRQSLGNREMSAGMMAAQAVNPNLLQPLQEAYAEWQARIENDGLDKVQATILRLAVDGLWFSEIFGLAPLESDFRQQVLEALLNETR